MSPFGAVYEEDDNWLVGYLATTEYAGDDRINSNPKTVPVKKEKVPCPSKSVSFGGAGSRRRSWAAPEVKVVPVREPPAPAPVASLPERVNAVRDAASVSGGNMVVREHGKAELPNTTGRSSWEEDEEAWNDSEAAKVRRQSLDYDELEAVKERIMQATSLWKRKNNSQLSMVNEYSVPIEAISPTVDSLVEARSVMLPPKEKIKDKSPKSLAGRSWLYNKWMNRFGGSKNRPT